MRIVVTEEKLRILAGYDGWKQYPQSQMQWAKHVEEIEDVSYSKQWLKNSELSIYVNSLDWLHPVAMRVIDELQGKHDDGLSKGVICRLKEACHTKPINGEYLDLYAATIAGIEFINKVRLKITTK